MRGRNLDRAPEIFAPALCRLFERRIAEFPPDILERPARGHGRAAHIDLRQKKRNLLFRAERLDKGGIPRCRFSPEPVVYMEHRELQVQRLTERRETTEQCRRVGAAAHREQQGIAFFDYAALPHRRFRTVPHMFSPHRLPQCSTLKMTSPRSTSPNFSFATFTTYSLVSTTALSFFRESFRSTSL